MSTPLTIRMPEMIVAACMLLCSAGRGDAATHHPRDASDLHRVLAGCAPGDRVELLATDYPGHFTVATSIVLAGNGAVLDGGGTGVVLTIDAPDVRLSGVHVRRGGTDLSGPDCGIYLTARAAGSEIVSNRVAACAFGIWAHETHDLLIAGNVVQGMASGHTSNRGNGIQLFHCRKVIVRHNRIRDGRDGIYISATENSLITDNDMTRCRYGIHYMYAYSNTVSGNISYANGHGYALMESKYLRVTHNVAENNAEHGLQFRDAQYCTIVSNRMSANGEGMFFYSSTENDIHDNLIDHNDVGIKVWAGSVRNRVTGNRIVGNRQQVFYVGTTEIEWGDEQGGNYWSDYLGWDQNGDGIGERPYRVNSFSARLLYRFPAAALLMSSPSLETLSLLERRLPVLRAPTITDFHPLLVADHD